MIKRILILGAGGTPATNFVRSLRMAKDEFYLVGTDINPYYLMRAETDKKYLVPKCHDKAYVHAINKIIINEKIEFVHAQNDTEIGVISEIRDLLKAPVYLPSREVVKICQNKWLSHLKWRNVVSQPKTLLIHSPKDVKEALDRFGIVWFRAIKGAGGKGSIKTDNFLEAIAWIDARKGWTQFTGAEYLSKHTVTWQSIYQNGRLIVAQTRKRLYWELPANIQSGVSGATGCGVTTSDPLVDETARKTIHAIEPIPHGIYSVDMTLDQLGFPVPTEINMRFFTTHHFFTEAGLNMPAILVQLASGEQVRLRQPLNPLKNDLAWIRGMDFKPIFTTIGDINQWTKNELS